MAYSRLSRRVSLTYDNPSKAQRIRQMYSVSARQATKGERAMTIRDDEIQWRSEWEAKSADEVREFLSSLKGKSRDELSDREWDFLLLIQEKYTAWAKPRGLATFRLRRSTRH